MEFLSPDNLEILSRLIIATLLGIAIGTERTMAHKTAGMRTYGLVSMGAASYIIISEIIAKQYLGLASLDPLRMASQIIVGVGFLGAGLIIFKESHLQGLTTAAGLWVSAAIGIAAGFGLYSISLFITIITLFVFTILWLIEKKIRKIAKTPDQDQG